MDGAVDEAAVAIARRERIRAAGTALGLTLVGFAPPVEPRGSRRLLEWLDRGYHGGMGWLARDPEARLSPDAILPGVRTVITVALRYGRPEPVPASPGLPRVSRYAWGDDYHEVLLEKLRSLDSVVRAIGEEAVGTVRTRLSCDTSPVMEKAWAEAGGLGWIGKNTCLIHPREGSWLFLSEIFTDLPLPPDPSGEDRCGTCRACLDGCPTGALPEPYLLDARRCISYLTIEHRQKFDAFEEQAVGEWIVGCDLCQDVCPWNRRAPLDAEVRFAPRPGLAGRTAEAWEAIDDAAYREAVRGTAVTRLKPWMMRRNARAVRANRDRARPGPTET